MFLLRFKFGQTSLLNECTFIMYSRNPLSLIISLFVVLSLYFDSSRPFSVEGDVRRGRAERVTVEFDSNNGTLTGQC